MIKICLTIFLLLTNVSANACISTANAKIKGRVVSIQSFTTGEYDYYLIEKKGESASWSRPGCVLVKKTNSAQNKILYGQYILQSEVEIFTDANGASLIVEVNPVLSH